MRSQILRLFHGEYKGTDKSICVDRSGFFLEKEILTRSSILGIGQSMQLCGSAATVCWYDILESAFDHALEMEMMDGRMLAQFLRSLCEHLGG